MFANKGLVSIIVPVYNVEKYLHECLDSILNQTYKEFELILINDGSSDRSGEICEEYKSRYSNIKVVHQENQGQAVARNNGVKIADAEWIMFIDSDDVIHPNLLEYLYRAVKESDSGMAVSQRVFADVIPEDFYCKYSFSYDVDEVTFDKLEECSDGKFYYWAPFPSIIKKEIVASIPFPSGRIYEDNAIGCRLVYNAKKIATVPYVMYFYRNNPNGTMKQTFNEKQLDYLWAFEHQIEFYKEINHQTMIKKTSRELLETALHYHTLSVEENNKHIESIVKKKIKNILKMYDEYIYVDKRIKNKLLKIYHPFLFKLKKKLKL